MYYDYCTAFFVTALLCWIAYAALLFRNKKIEDAIPSILSVLSVFALNQSGYFGQFDATMLAVSFGIALISSILVQFYMVRPKIFVALALLMLSGFFLYHANKVDFATMGFFGVSTMYGLVYRELRTPRKHTPRDEKRKEIGRDIVQMVLGVVVVALLLTLWNIRIGASIAVWSIFFLIVLGYTVSGKQA